MKVKGIKKLKKGLHQREIALHESLDDAVKKLAYIALTEARKNLRRNKNIDTGQLLNSLDAQRIEYAKWGVGASVKHMWYIEYGTRPHKPPLRPLVEWVKRKNKLYGQKGYSKAYPIAKAVQKTIELKGTKPYPYLRPAKDTALKQASRIIRATVRGE